MKNTSLSQNRYFLPLQIHRKARLFKPNMGTHWYSCRAPRNISIHQYNHKYEGSEGCMYTFSLSTFIWFTSLNFHQIVDKNTKAILMLRAQKKIIGKG